MSRDVNVPPALVAQQTGAWCFAAAEQMARAYYGLPVLNQYEIAYNSLMQLVGAMAPPHLANWNNATLLDLMNGVVADITPAQLAVSGNPPNPNSQRVALVQNTMGAFNIAPFAGASLGGQATQGNFRADIEANKIVVIGNFIHYYVVYGYNDINGFDLKVRDPMPTGVGGLSTAVPYANFNAWHAKVVIRF
ncbi:hypothetical protein [Desulfatibacillum aliphaticivorans]|uniref:Peptidase C39-like domain-containing protein n=1 Tax=Desulfatibacillum aliphaticivorans TaxID=218208 RepID=B8FBB8_DESAL|nr:hypothetical protein [Desulfatibacillum aliphaticivorans]ACL04562.1 hypothetical protein Dalk_2872 [Desulfatibacillum aliphaticivorans]